MKAQPSRLMTPPLDPAFEPVVLFNRRSVETARQSGHAVPLVIAVEREGGAVSRHETVVKREADPETLRYAERIVKFLLWAQGGWKVCVGGPAAVGQYVARCYAPDGERRFDVELMSRVYERPFEVAVMDSEAVPAARDNAAALGGHLDGCRIGFDLGASDYKVAAVRDGEVVYSEEFPWQPREQPDPEYHYTHLTAGLKKAAAHLPRVEAIGGSSAGVIVDNKIMVASLFRAVPLAEFHRARNLFLRIRDEWNVPLAVANDGDVTALAGSMSLQTAGLLGLAMGSSQAAGYLDPRGRMTGALSELAFAPVDCNPAAPADEWSGDRGVGVMYFSQQAVTRLLPAAGIALPERLGLPERLEAVQGLMAKDDPRASRIYETLGVYLGYTIPYYAAFYAFDHVLILGRVTTGPGGEILLRRAREVLERLFPEEAAKIRLHVPDEKSRRVGQAVAAASLPRIRDGAR
jgi:predicted NBD/HSP70 family sugar kinase